MYELCNETALKEERSDRHLTDAGHDRVLTSSTLNSVVNRSAECMLCSDSRRLKSGSMCSSAFRAFSENIRELEYSLDKTTDIAIQ